MTILIANIGPSDLAIKIDDFYLPISFDSHHSQVDPTDLTPEEETAWNNRHELIAQKLCPELKITTTNQQSPHTFNFRQLTKNILAEYTQNPTTWQNRLYPGNLMSVINKAYHEFEVKKAYIFVTNQNAENPEDSIHLFEILKTWLANRYGDLVFTPVLIPDTINTTNLDDLLDFYYQFFQENFQYALAEEVVLVSIPGGTNQMENALRLQSLNSTLQNLLFVEPLISLKNLLNAQGGDCKLTSYWQYLRPQKYQTAIQLIQSWDFVGATNILRNWHKVLKFLSQEHIIGGEKIVHSRDNLDLVIKALFCSSFLFNLDITNAVKLLQDNPQLASSPGLRLHELMGEENECDTLLNLYTITLINRELNNIGSFLINLSIFQEGVIYKIIEKYNGLQYIDTNNCLITENIEQDFAPNLYQPLSTTFNNQNNPPFDNRPIQKSFVEALLQHQQNKDGLSNLTNLWSEQKKLLESLDYWVDQRNYLIHSIEGITLNKLHDLNHEKPDNACAYRDITLVMAKLLNNQLLDFDHNQLQEFANTGHFYIYANVRDWAIAQLHRETMST